MADAEKILGDVSGLSKQELMDAVCRVFGVPTVTVRYTDADVEAVFAQVGRESV